ncbi:BCAS3 microtubule associated cell migration factor-like isoform X2 [Oscarella lobularis]|uniref:BCAS3 microtubule associated cell migration factor-like isoform X2 n=1 Tax=Oscarella lobularis TaxID=121494 RepID=UPI0033138E0F
MAADHKATVVAPETPPDKTYMDTVRGFLQAVQQGVTTQSTRIDDKDRVLWVRFEELNSPTGDKESTPILLIIGYSNGFQVWSIDASGSRLATEILSLRQDPVRHCTLLTSPLTLSDQFVHVRPLLAVCDSSCRSGKSSSSPPYGTVGIFSLTTGKEVIKEYSFTQEVSSILSNRRVIVVALQNEIHGLDAESLVRKFLITRCYPAPMPGIFPVSLGSRWLAYADRKLTVLYQSCGGVSAESASSYKSSVFSAAKSTLDAAQQGISFLSETVGRWTGTQSPTSEEKQSRGMTPDQMPGIVSVVDIFKIKQQKVAVEKQETGEAIVAHFEAHIGQPIVSLAFDPSGQLLVTACKLGHKFHVFRLLPHPCHPSLGAVHHLYTLFRGDTEAIVQGISFTRDSRWVAATTLRGTTHVFPITPYGGPIEKRTHTGLLMVNRLSRFRTSAGLGEHPTAQEFSSIGSPPSTSPNHFSAIHPPPKTVAVNALARISSKPTAMSAGSGGGGSTSSVAGVGTATEAISAAASFSGMRRKRKLSQSGELGSNTRRDNDATFSLFTVGIDGVVLEHVMDPRVLKGSPDLETSPIELEYRSVQQWSLQRSASSSVIALPLPSSNPLIAFHRQQKDVSSEYLDKGKKTDETDDTRWLANIEIHTYEAPARRLWMGPQFTFKTFKPVGVGSAQDEMDDLLGAGGDGSATIETQADFDMSMDPSTLGLQSLNIHRRDQTSQPIPTPTRGLLHRDAIDIVVDAGPGSLELTQLEIPGSWQSDEDSSSAKERVLEKHLADAMEDVEETQAESGVVISVGQAPAAATAAVVHESPSPGPSFHSSSSPHHAMVSPLIKASGGKVVKFGGQK